MKEIGTVISTFDSPTPSMVRFVVNEGIVHRGQFVEMNYSEGILIALVTNVIKTNKYFERADSVKEFESNGQALIEQFPTTEWEFLVAETRPLGVFTEALTKRSTYPPSPGTKVKLASKENLKKFFSFDEEKGLDLGEVEYHDVPVKINMTKMLQKHCAILALSGAGKSYFVSILIEELLERKKEHGRIATIVLDVHGEYTSFAEPIKEKKKYKDYSNKTKVIKARDIKIGVPRLSSSLLASILPGLSAPQKRDLGKIISKLRKEMKDGLGPYDLSNIRKELMGDEEIKENTKKALWGWIAELEELHLFTKVDSPSIEDIVLSGMLTVIDLSEILFLKKKQIIVNYFSHKLFSLRREKLLPPFLLILEEAHQFIPERAGKEAAISRSILQTIAREGRKFGA
ncbi:ATP-binding protein, partial [Candidatus Micrarchaeota archaeon]|nr:ATP-binding protein [Candidatus Micrarchaeota archaeon]